MRFYVRAYSINEFRQIVLSHSEASPEVIDRKLRSRYFEDYFAALAIKTIVVEEDYIDHDYLEDFSAYYVKCFHAYKRTCTRLHFFKAEFDEDSLSRYLRGECELTRELTDSYAGFIVIRPLPASIIGRTCLAPYDDDNGRRHFPTVHCNSANLLGLDLTIRALPFQEQDQVTAACATSALWSAFQATGRLFHHRLPSPVEITSAAALKMPARSRILPNTHGLTIEQMAHAIREVGLEPYFVAGNDQAIFRQAVYAYLAGGIPPLVITRLTGERSGTREAIGYHAATVTGYSMPRGKSAASPAPGEYNSSAATIDKLYVHDDQVGPHARMEFQSSALGDWYLNTSWGLCGDFVSVRAEPIAVLLPLYNKIRMPFTRPVQDLLQFDRVFRAFGVDQITDGLVWDLRLTMVNRLKGEVLHSKSASATLREDILKSSLPKFMWHATAKNTSGLLMDVLFDATDIDAGKYIARIDVHDALLRSVLDLVQKKYSETPIGDAVSGLLGKMNQSTSPSAQPNSPLNLTCAAHAS